MYKRPTPETFERGWGRKSPRTADRMERYVQQTWTGSKFGVMWVGHRRNKLDGKKLEQRDNFVDLGGAICGVGNSLVSTRKNPWDLASTLAWVFI